MKSNKRTAPYLAGAAIIAAMYVAVTFAQQLILPGTATLTVQFRISEALTVLCVFMPCAIPGLTAGCFLANIISSSSVIPTDILLGTLATFLSCEAMYLLRRIRIKNLPVLSALMPALFNGIIIGLELEIFYVAGEFEFTGFLIQGGCVALGEAAVCLLLGLPLLHYLEKSKIAERFTFS